jgi:hypothetical protein
MQIRCGELLQTVIKMNPLIISFYTNDWEYPAHAIRLTEECKHFNLEYYIEERETTTDYIKNTAIKPFFIRDCLHKFKRPVFWIDVDALILKPIDINIKDYDLAACQYTNKNINREWAVASLYFNYTEASIMLLDYWCDHTNSGTDEASFDVAWKKIKEFKEVKVLTLPETYHFVKWSYKLDIPEDTVICHQISKSEDKLRRKHKVETDE